MCRRVSTLNILDYARGMHLSMHQILVLEGCISQWTTVLYGDMHPVIQHIRFLYSVLEECISQFLFEFVNEYDTCPHPYIHLFAK